MFIFSTRLILKDRYHILTWCSQKLPQYLAPSRLSINEILKRQIYCSFLIIFLKRTDQENDESRMRGVNGNRKKQICSMDTEEIGERDTCVCVCV